MHREAGPFRSGTPQGDERTFRRLLAQRGTATRYGKTAESHIDGIPPAVATEVHESEDRCLPTFCGAECPAGQSSPGPRSPTATDRGEPTARIAAESTEVRQVLPTALQGLRRVSSTLHPDGGARLRCGVRPPGGRPPSQMP
ncbi:hypothetical protein GCM10009678_69980 [Actinomadura kijaniata]